MLCTFTPCAPKKIATGHASDPSTVMSGVLRHPICEPSCSKARVILVSPFSSMDASKRRSRDKAFGYQCLSLLDIVRYDTFHWSLKLFLDTTSSYYLFIVGEDKLEN